MQEIENKDGGKFGGKVTSQLQRENAKCVPLFTVKRAFISIGVFGECLWRFIGHVGFRTKLTPTIKTCIIKGSTLSFLLCF